MPEMSKVITPKRMGDKEPNEKIAALGKKITDVVAHKLKGVTSNDPEYWGLAEIVTDEMADVALKMELRHHYTLDQMCDLTGTDKNDKAAKDKLNKLLEEMSYIGILEYDYGYHYDHNGRTAPQSERRYLLPMFVPGSAELLNMEETKDKDGKTINKRIEDHPEVTTFFERMTYIPLEGITQMVPPGGSGVGMHVIPVEKAIEMENTSIDLEHLSYWLKKYEGHIGVGQCSCRASRAKMEEGCADDQYAWCIGVGDFADYCRETGKGHDITYDEAMAILKRAEDNGFVHQVTNIDGENKIFGICNCNINICNALRTSQLFNTPNMSRSAYTAKVETEKCVACGKCVEYCPSGAVKLGQKLCTKVGPVVYPRVDTPTNKKWDKSRYDENYRDDNRINCYDTGTAPCKTACPAHIAIQGYIKKAKEGKYDEALALIKKDNPFPAVCGRICNKRCEAACTRGTIDQAVSIDAIKNFVAQRDIDSKTRYIPPVVMPVSTSRNDPLTQWEQKIAIIGAGPAGLSAAYYLATMGYKPTVYEKNKKLGGMLTYGIPSYKLEKDVIEAEIDVLRALGVEFKCGVEVGKDITIPELKKKGYQAFYIAIGCQGGRYPGVMNDTAAGTSIAVDFLRQAAENHEQKLDGKVVVIGGGNVAIDCARTAHRFNPESVTMVSLETRDTMPAAKIEVEEAEEENVKVINAYGPKEVLVDDKGHVKGIVLKKCTRTIDPETKRFSPLYDENDTMTLDADHIIYAIGQKIEWGKLLEGTTVALRKNGAPIADALTYQTADPDVFVGGDVLTGPKFVIDAIAQGHYAAESLHRHVHKGASLTIGRNTRQFVELDKNNIVVEDYDHEARHDEKFDKKIDHTMSFQDARKLLTEAEVKKEASRCLGCGASVVDPNKCIGCGVCTTKCMFDAIHLHRDHPEATKMLTAEDKFKGILPYQLKRMGRILVHYTPKEEKEYNKKYKAFRKAIGKPAEEGFVNTGRPTK